MEKLWGGRFEDGMDEAIARLNNSFAFDVRLWREDIQGSIAHARMLGATGIIPADEAAEIVAGLKRIEQGIGDRSLDFDPDSEDIHTAVELLLRETIGPVAGKLHTARSRNDQVATDTRLYVRGATEAVVKAIVSFQRVLLSRAEQEIETPVSGYTHLQHAQPVSLAHHLLAYLWMLQRDRERFEQSLPRTNVLPLGSGALAGTAFPIDRNAVARELGFARISENSMDAVSDRDYILEFLSHAAILAVHLSRLGEDIILWNSREFSYVDLHDSVATGSSIMPQKKNPDVAELARAKAGRIIGNLTGLLVVCKGLPLAYNKDLQEDKERLFDTTDTLLMVLPALERTLQTVVFRRERMAEALQGDFSTATDLADHLARRGMPFRQAHEVAGRIVRDCCERGRSIEELSEAELVSFAPEFAGCGDALANPASSMRSRNSPGGGGPAAVTEQLQRARQLLEPQSTGA